MNYIKDVQRENGVAKRVVATTGSVDITFVAVGGKPKEVGRTQPGAMVYDRQNMFIPHGVYGQMLRQVYGVLGNTRAGGPTGGTAQGGVR